MSRGRGWGLAVLACAFAAFLAFVLLRPPPPSPPVEIPWRVDVTPLAPGTIDGERGAASDLEGLLAPGARGTGAGTAPGTSRGDLVVHVVSAEGRRPVAGASVWLLVETERSLVEGWACLARAASGPLPTDDNGRVALPWGDAAGTCRVVGHAAGHGAGALRLEAGASAEVTLTLPVGLRLSGQVVDTTGFAQPGLLLVARAAARPRQETEAAERRGPEAPDPGAERLATRSDAHGGFTFDGLSAGSYVVTVEEPGWVVRGPYLPSTYEGLPGTRGLVARAGDSGARLVVARVGLVSLHLVDATSRQDVSATWSTASVTVPGRADATVVTSYAGRAVALPTGEGEPLVLAPAEQPPSRLLATVPWDAQATHAQVEVRAAGYRPARTQAPLQPVPAAARGIAALAPVVVPLERERPAGPCDLVLDCTRETGGILRPATRRLTLCDPRDGTRTHVAGRLLDGERWLFGGLPAGAGVAEVWDGLSFSTPVEVTLAPESPTEARAAFGPLTGALFVLRDARGRRVYDAEALLIAPKGRDRGLPDRSEATRLERGRERLVPLEPGEYRFGVAKPGVGYAGGSFSVRPGEVVRVEAHLALPQASDAGRRAR